ncbi:MAG: hypothetical protein JWL83_2723 [Actinomycetia bacterium]|nr:hypothetical protein [Actinomycetes bacterium]
MSEGTMQLQDHLHRIPSTMIRTWLHATRLPLRAAELVARRHDNDAPWPPSLAFESLEAQVKQVAGAVLRDDDLVREGFLIQARVAELRKAAELETVAQARRAAAAANHQTQQEKADQRRQRIEAETAARKRELERQRAAKRTELDREAQRKQTLAARETAASRKAVERQERAAARTRIATEREALRKERAATTAKKRAVNTDKKIRATKAARRATR